MDKDDSSLKKADLKRRIDKRDEEHFSSRQEPKRNVLQKKIGKIRYQPEVGKWIKRRNVLR